MNKLFFLFLFVAGISFTTKAQSDTLIKQSVIPVLGDCDNCKINIEKAASYVKGVKKASWDKDQQLLTVVYRTDKTTELQIEEAIAKAGYDTRDVKADEKAYEKLPACCHYRTVEKH